MLFEDAHRFGDQCAGDCFRRHRGGCGVLQQSRDVLGDKLIGRGHRFLRGLCHTGWAAVSAGASSNASVRSEEHTSELQSLMRISYAVFCLKKTKLSI